MQPGHIPFVNERRPPAEVAQMRLTGDTSVETFEVALDPRLPFDQGSPLDERYACSRRPHPTESSRQYADLRDRGSSALLGRAAGRVRSDRASYNATRKILAAASRSGFARVTVCTRALCGRIGLGSHAAQHSHSACSRLP